MTTINIRLATTTDIPQLLNLIAGVVPLMQAAGNYQWDSTYPNAAVFTEDIKLSQLWVADINGQVAGVAAITTDQDEEYADVGWNINETAIVTHRLAVSVYHQGLGIAKALLQKAEEVARQQSISILRVDTNSENKATQKLFPQLGYTFAGEITLAFREGLRFFCYEKRLKKL
jgi:N-acetylglutamate synthase-like GNAT family acetyltransferase